MIVIKDNDSKMFPYKVAWDSGKQSSVFPTKDMAIEYAKMRFALGSKIIDRTGAKK